MVQAIKQTTKERIAQEVAKVVGAGRAVAVETVDFSDANRPKTCLEVDFPILPINQIATIEGKGSGALKPVYQVMKWWARRRSTVFRQLLIAAAMKAPADNTQAARTAWEHYYANHQKRGALKHLKVADIFMGGGTTIVEGSRLGMEMFGIDLNPVAWFIVKTELAKVDLAEVQALLDHVEREVKPQIIPFYACVCPRGHKGTWTGVSDGRVMGESFDPLQLTLDERGNYKYEGPQIIYTFWAKHAPCQITGCNHRTPIMSTPVIATKAVTVKAWINHRCSGCQARFDVELADTRMAPGAPLVLSEAENRYAVRNEDGGVTCPHCGHNDRFPRLSGKPKKKRLELTLLIDSSWLRGCTAMDAEGRAYGGSASDEVEATSRWYNARMSNLSLIEVRGKIVGSNLPINTTEGTVPKSGVIACGACGIQQKVKEALEHSGKTAPEAAYAVQGYCPDCARRGDVLKGKFFAAALEVSHLSGSLKEWHNRKEADLSDFWPRNEMIEGQETKRLFPIGYSHWWKMFNPRQLVVLSSLLRSISLASKTKFSDESRDFVLGIFQQYLRNQNTFCLWNYSARSNLIFQITITIQSPTLLKVAFFPESLEAILETVPRKELRPWNGVQTLGRLRATVTQRTAKKFL